MRFSLCLALVIALPLASTAASPQAAGSAGASPSRTSAPPQASPNSSRPVGGTYPDIETIYFIPLSHTDIGFTAPPRVVAEQMNESAQAAIDEAARNADYVWNFETFWQLDQWLQRHDDPSPVVELLREGRFGVGAAYVNPHSSLMSAWALEQLFGLPAEWAAAHDVPLDWAVIDDVPGHPHDLPCFLSAAGVRYLALGVNQSFSPRLAEEVSNTPFWWQGPDGSRVLTWISADGYTEAYTRYGVDPATARFFNPGEFTSTEPLHVMREGISRMLAEYHERDYPYDAVLALHGFDNWGSAASRRLPEAVRLWNEWADSAQTDAEEIGQSRWPRLAIATPRQFFRHVEERYGDQLPVYRGGFGGQWEVVRTGIPTATARALAQEQRLRSMQEPPRDEVAELLVFWEHSFSMGPPWPGLLTREQFLDHNRQQWDMIADWPLQRPQWPEAEPVELPSVGRESSDAEEATALQSNHLYLVSGDFVGVPGGESRFEPLPGGAWLLARAERLEDGTLRLRHAIDRRALPATAHVVWAWRLNEEDADGEATRRDAASTLPLVVETATGRTRPFEDGLAGYRLGHWIATREFRIGETLFDPSPLETWSGPFVFYTIERYPGWLLARVLDQQLEATFRGDQRATLTFEQTYPGELPVYVLAIEIRGSDE